MTLILTIEIHVLQKRAYLTYSAIKVVYTAFTLNQSHIFAICCKEHIFEKISKSRSETNGYCTI